jgi:S-DNA-T family DNA segregation ATPase FtsK/SpoIIIE
VKKRNRKSKGKEENQAERPPGWFGGLSQDTRNGVLAVAAFIAAVLLLLSYLGKSGVAGQGIFRLLDATLGSGYFFAPVMFFLVGFSFLFGSAHKLVAPTAIGGLLFLLSSLGILNILFGSGTGGVLGGAISFPLLRLFDFWAGLVIASGMLIISILLVFDIPLLWKRLKDEAGDQEELPASSVPASGGSSSETDASLLSRVEALIASRMPKENSPVEAIERNNVSLSPPQATQKPDEGLIPLKQGGLGRLRYKKPGLELLQGDRGTPSSGDIRANANIIKRTLENFGISVEMGEVAIGPTLTQYTLRPAEGVKLSKIVALHSNLSLALASPNPIRIEAPIPGKSLVGIEVPNRSIALVGLRSLLSEGFFQDSPQPLLVALGRDVAGTPVFADLARMPHLLISGATGSGKSVAIHTIVSSLLYRNGPQLLRFILVDPKRVELPVYNDIPHLLTPVITDAKKTIQALRWASKEMDRRYDLLSLAHERDIAGYNLNPGRGANNEPLPYIVIIIDELADLMAIFPREVESSIIRLAQMARAVGIHLIVATQRPSVEVITGLIKANITSRLAFQVASQVDSRTIIDGAGAEKLLGNGRLVAHGFPPFRNSWSLGTSASTLIGFVMIPMAPSCTASSSNPLSGVLPVTITTRIPEAISFICFKVCQPSNPPGI